MGRNDNFPSFWNSRLKLCVSSAFLSVCITLVHLRSYAVEQEYNNRNEEPIDDFYSTVERAMADVQYMYDLKDRKAFIRPVVEKPQPVSESSWFCYLTPPETVKHEGWTESDGFFLFSSYYDGREDSLFPRNDAVQVLLMSDGKLETVKDVFCNIFIGRRSFSVKGFVREIWQKAWDPRDSFYVPNLITCPIPSRWRDSLGPSASVSIVTSSCKSSKTAIQIKVEEQIPEDEKKDVAVCIKGMDFQDDNSLPFIEWMESQLMFGVDEVTIYTYLITENTQKVVDYYEKSGKLKQIKISLPGNSPNFSATRSSYIWRNRQQKRRHELIPYNDCLYRHMNTHRFILIVDTDEIIVPLESGNYPEMLKKATKDREKPLSSISARNVFKFPEAAGNRNKTTKFTFIDREYRSKKTNRIGEYGKSFTSTSSVATVFNHFALHKLSNDVQPTMHLHEEIAVKLHFKEKCPIESQKECEELMNDTIVDDSMKHFEYEWRRRTEEAMREIGISRVEMPPVRRNPQPDKANMPQGYKTTYPRGSPLENSMEHARTHAQQVQRHHIRSYLNQQGPRTAPYSGNMPSTTQQRYGTSSMISSKTTANGQNSQQQGYGGSISHGLSNSL